MDDLLAFLLAALALIGSPGPATLSLAATGAAYGVKRGVPYLIGIWVGVMTVTALTATGVTGLILAVPGVAPVVAVLAAAYIIYLAYRIATAPPLGGERGNGASPSFPGGLFLGLANPKAYASMAALYSGFVLVGGAPVLDALAKGSLIGVIVISVDSCWLFAGSALTRVFGDPRASRIINIGFATLLVISVVFALLI